MVDTLACFNLAINLPAIGIVFLILKSSESPRWLYTNNRQKEAEDIFKNIGYLNGNGKSEIRLSPLKKTQTDVIQEKPLDILKSGKILLRLIIMMLVFFTGSLVYYGITFGTQQLSSNVYTGLILSSLAEVPGGFLGFTIMQLPTFGRKRTLILFLILVGTGSFLLDILHLRGTSKMLVALLSKTLIEGTWAVNNPYSVELFPTSVRSICLAVLAVSSQLSGMVAPFLTDFGKILIDPNDSDASFIFYACLALLSAVMVWKFLPETLGTPTHDTIESLDGFSGNSRGYTRLLQTENL